MFARCKVFLLELYTGDLSSRNPDRTHFSHFCSRQLPVLDPWGLRPVHQTFIERAY